MARYSVHGATKSPISATSRPISDWNWRSLQRPQPSLPEPQQTQQQQQVSVGQGQSPVHPMPMPMPMPIPSFPNHPHNFQNNNVEVINRYRTPSERAFDSEFLLDILHACGADYQTGAQAIQVEQRLLETVQGLYEIKPGVKKFNHYLMNMRAAGAPIW